MIVDLTKEEFIGRLVPLDVDEYYDPKLQGRYKVHIPTLMQHLEKEEGIWVKNHAHKWRITPSEVGEYGSYFPLHAGTYVIVKFYRNDPNSGYIDRVISDWKEDRDVEAQDCVEEKPIVTDRDEQYVIFKTPKKWNAFYINEETENEPNTIYLIYNRDDDPERRTVYRINESGIHIWTRDNKRVRIIQDENTQIDGDRSRYVKGDQRQNIDGYDDTHIRKDRTSQIDQDEHYRIKQNYYHQTDEDYHRTILGKRFFKLVDDEHIIKESNSTKRTEGNVYHRIGKDEEDSGEAEVQSSGGGNYRKQIDEDEDYLIEGDNRKKIDGNEDRITESDFRRKIDGNEDRITESDFRKKIDGNEDRLTKGRLTVEIQGNVNLSVDGDINIWSGSNINIDSEVNINLNSNIANRTPAAIAHEAQPPEIPEVPELAIKPEPPEPKIEVKDLGPDETPEYKTGVGDPCDDRTDAYNVGEREEEKMFV